MSGYKIYLEDSVAQIPKTTRYNRHDEREPKNSSDSSEDDKYRELANQSSSAEDEVPNASSPIMHHVNDSFELPNAENEFFQEEWVQEVYDEMILEEHNENTDTDDDLVEGFNDDSVEDDHNYLNNLYEMLQEDKTNSIIDEPLAVNKAEIYLAVLKFSLTYNLPQSVPDTRYFIDKIFNSKDNVEYHALCPRCKRYIKKFNEEDRSIQCNVCQVAFLVKDPTYVDFFTIINPKSEIIHLIESNYDYYQSVKNKRMQNEENFDEFTSGYLYRKIMNSLSRDLPNDFITATFNSDGAPVFKSSKFSIWPIQLLLNEIPFQVRTAHPIVCGLWFGKDKPNMNIFLQPFVTQMNTLANEGVTCNIRNEQTRIHVFTLCCCVDTIARAPMQGVKQFNGHYGCNWCLHPGYYVAYGRGGSIKYILLDEPTRPRTHENMIRHMQETVASGQPVYEVKTATVLANLLGFNVVSSFVPDSMHCIDEGIAEQFLKYWIETHGMPYSLTSEEIVLIDNMLTTIKVPEKVSRLSRSIRDRSYWKAKKWENWVLYYSIPILMCFPRLKCYVEHWALLMHAYYILLQTSITPHEVKLADSLLKRFVTYTEFYYSKTAMTYNVHQLLHLAQSVVDWGPLWAHSGYCFESGNGKIVKTIHAAKGVTFQICRIIAMRQSDFIMKKHIMALNPLSKVLVFANYLDTKYSKSSLKISNSRYFGVDYPISQRWIQQLHLSDHSRIYRKMVKEQCLYTSSRKTRLRSNNSIAITKDGRFIQILDFIVDTQHRQESTICNLIYTANILNNDSLPVKKIMYYSNERHTIRTSYIDKICVVINTDDSVYICPVPNLFSY